MIIPSKNAGDDSKALFFFTGAEVTQKILTVAPVSAGGVVCLEWEWKQPVIHD